MGRYAAQRIALAVPVLFGVLLIGFLLMQVVPTDPATVRAGPQATAEVVAAIRAELGLDAPLPGPDADDVVIRHDLRGLT